MFPQHPLDTYGGKQIAMFVNPGQCPCKIIIGHYSLPCHRSFRGLYRRANHSVLLARNQQREDIVQIIRRALLASVLLPTVAFAQQSTKSSPPDLNVYSRPAIPEDVAGN